MSLHYFRSVALSHVYDRVPSVMVGKKSEMLCRIMQHAYCTSPYYKEIFDITGVPKSSDQALGLLTEIPVLNKDIIRRRLNEVISDTSKYQSTMQYWNTSGGSTGEPIQILQDKRYLSASRYITYQQKKSAGFEWGQPLLKIWGDENELMSGKQGFKGRAVNILKNQIILNSFSMTDEVMTNYLDRINLLKTGLIVSYVQSLHQLAQHAKEQGLGVNFDGPIIVSAGTLYPFMKEEISNIFNSKIFNRYGSREVGNIGIADPHSEFFRLNKGCWVEVLDDDDQPLPFGTEGNIVVTSLINYSMPLLRYKLGDRGCLSRVENSHGKSEVVLSRLTGRSVDLFLTAHGATIDGEFFTHLIYFRPWVKRFQFIQKAIDLVEFKYIENYAPPQSELLEISEKIQFVMGSSCRVKFQKVNEIIPTSSGKFRFTINEMTYQATKP